MLSRFLTFNLILMLTAPVYAADNIAAFDSDGLVIINKEIDRIDKKHGWALGTSKKLIVSSGEVTLTSHYNRVDTEAGAATDDIDTINGGSVGDVVIFRSVDDSRDPTFKDATGNMQLAGDFTLSDTDDTITLLKRDSTTWTEISRSNNT